MEATRAALVVAAHEFVDPKFQRLRSPAQDVDALAGVLGEEGIGGFEIKTVVNQTSFVVQQELERFFSGRKPDDLLLLYFSCHGVKDPSGRLYFVTTNTAFDLLRSTGVSASFVSEQMEYSRSKRIVVLLDCCYSGAFLKGFRARGDDSVAVDQLEGRGRAVITASRATEYAFEADLLAQDNAQPSLFTGAIVEGLTTGKADVNGDGFVTVDELYDYVYDAVRNKVAGQTPGRWTDVEGNLVIARNPRPPVRSAPLPPELQRAVESDAGLQRLGAVSELTQWYRGVDAERRLAAATVLEQLTRDYDERVKKAAAAALDPERQPAVVAAPEPVGPVPVLAPEAPGPELADEPLPTPAVEVVPKAEPIRAPAAEIVAEPIRAPAAEVVPKAEPIRAPAAEIVAEPIRAPAGEIMATEPIPAPAVAGPAETAGGAAARATGPRRPSGFAAPVAGGFRVPGYMAAGGGLAVLLSPYLSYIRYDGYSDSLTQRNWFSLGALVIFGLAAYAADCLLRTRSPGTGLAVLVGLLPVATAEAVGHVSKLVFDDSVVSPGPGWVLCFTGLTLLATAGLLAAVQWRRHMDFLSARPSAAARSIGATAAAIVVGAASSFGWARAYGIKGEALFGVASPVQTMILRLVVVSAAVWLGERWVPFVAAKRPAVLTGSFVLIVALFVSNDLIWDSGKVLLFFAFAALAVGGAVVPVLATVVVPVRQGLVLLAAWIAASAAWVPSALGQQYDAEGVAIALVAAAGVAAFLATRLPRTAGRAPLNPLG
ncbi:MAG: caspase, EACC1-associated type [Acidimicrobiales bacterium]